MAGTKLSEAINGGQFVIAAECRPPRGAGMDVFTRFATLQVQAIGVPESEDGVRQCSFSGCNHLLNSGAEPILHLVTRDMNRIALQATILGAASMGIPNVLCTSGRHQALTTSPNAKGVFDLDPIQLLQVADAMRKDGVLADGTKLDAPVDLLLGTDTNPFADPMELHVWTLDRAASAGADFVITQPVFDLGEFEKWMSEVRSRGVHSKTCIIASVLASVPEDVADRHKHYTPGAKPEEIAAGLRKVEGVGGIYVMAGDDFEAAAKLISGI